MHRFATNCLWQVLKVPRVWQKWLQSLCMLFSMKTMVEGFLVWRFFVYLLAPVKLSFLFGELSDAFFLFFCFWQLRLLQHVEIPIPSPKRDEVLVKLEAASLNPADWKIQKGTLRPLVPRKFPFIPGNYILQWLVYGYFFLFLLVANSSSHNCLWSRSKSP